MTKQEAVLLREGWISAKLAAAKLGVHVVTIHRLIYDGKIKARDVRLVGRTKFVRLEAFIASQPGAIIKSFGLDDWSEELADSLTVK